MILLLEYKPFVAAPEDTKLIFIRERYPYYRQIIRIHKGHNLFAEDDLGYVTKGMYKL